MTYIGIEKSDVMRVISFSETLEGGDYKKCICLLTIALICTAEKNNIEPDELLSAVITIIRQFTGTDEEGKDHVN